MWLIIFGAVLVPGFTMFVSWAGLFSMLRHVFHWPGYPPNVWTIEYVPYLIAAMIGAGLAFVGYRRSGAWKAFLLTVVLNAMFALYFVYGLVSAWGTPIE